MRRTPIHQGQQNQVTAGAFGELKIIFYGCSIEVKVGTEAVEGIRIRLSRGNVVKRICNYFSRAL